QQAGNQVVARDGVGQLVGEGAALVGEVEQPLQAGAVEVGDEPDELLGAVPADRAAGRAGGGDQGVDPVAGGPPVLLRHGLLATGGLRGRVQQLQLLPTAEVHVHA